MPHQAVEQEGGVLGHAIVFGEELLELVDDQEGAREAVVRGGPVVGRQVLDAGLPEQVAAALQFLVEAFEDA